MVCCNLKKNHWQAMKTPLNGFRNLSSGKPIYENVTF
jgi:hypothetical protein